MQSNPPMDEHQEKLEAQAALVVTSVGNPATTDEIRDLPHVSAPLPLRVWLAAIIGMAERFSYYGTQTLFQNYLQYRPHDLVPGAMGLGKSRATMVNLAFTVLVNILPLPASILIYGCIYAIGSAILFATSFPFEILAGFATPGFVVGTTLIAFGFGGVQSSIQPFITDQYTEDCMRIRVTKCGKRVVEDRELTIQYIYNLYYWMVNVGSLGSIATTLMEKYIGFWSAYLLDICAVVFCVLIVQLGRSKFVHPSIQGSKLPQAARYLWYAAQGGWTLNAALPQNQLDQRGRVVPWDQDFIVELRDALSAFKVCIGWPIFWVCIGEGAHVSISQAGQMETYRIPNDLIKSANPLAYVVFGLIIQQRLYPSLQRHKIQFNAVSRITLGFGIMSVAMAYSAVVQGVIYREGPCYSYPLGCNASEGGQIANHVHVLWQLPNFVIIALAEVFCWPTGSEYTYSHAPRSMKSILQACYIGTAGLGYMLGMALSPLAEDPLLVTLWSLAAGMMLVTTCTFYVAFRKY